MMHSTPKQRLLLACFGVILVLGAVASTQVWDVTSLPLVSSKGGEPLWMNGLAAVAACTIACICAYLATQTTRS